MTDYVKRILRRRHDQQSTVLILIPINFLILLLIFSVEKSIKQIPLAALTVLSLGLTLYGFYAPVKWFIQNKRFTRIYEYEFHKFQKLQKEFNEDSTSKEKLKSLLVCSEVCLLYNRKLSALHVTDEKVSEKLAEEFHSVMGTILNCQDTFSKN